MFWLSSLAIMGIKCCRVEALSNLAPHLKQLHTALWGLRWSGLACGVGMGLGFLFFGTNLSSKISKHIKTNSIGLQCVAECCYEQKEQSQA